MGVKASVDDVDARTKAAAAAGGKELHEPIEVPHMARVSIVMDPTGAVIALHKNAAGDPEPVMSAGVFCWEQRVTTDDAAAKEFYRKVLAWQVHDEGAMATFGVGEGMMNQVASIVQAPAGVASHWVSSIAVRNLEKAKDIVRSHRGKIVIDKVEVPMSGAFAVVNDPQDAIVCVFEGNSSTPILT
jgi:predicted enzyme related to lactoylglutathione lyase